MTRPPLMGVCASCGGDYRLTKDGNIWDHGRSRLFLTFPRTPCPGAGRPPKKRA